MKRILAGLRESRKSSSLSSCPSLTAKQNVEIPPIHLEWIDTSPSRLSRLIISSVCEVCSRTINIHDIPYPSDAGSTFTTNFSITPDEIIASTLAFTLFEVMPTAVPMLINDALQSFDNMLIIFRSVSSRKCRSFCISQIETSHLFKSTVHYLE